MNIDLNASGHRLRALVATGGIACLGLCLSGCGASSSSSPAPAATTAPAATPVSVPRPTAAAAGQVSFKGGIAQIFGAHCAACHINQQLGGLNLGNYQGLVKGGNVVSGPVFKAGDHKASYLWQIVQPHGPWPGGNRMPLGGPYLTAAQIGTIAAWIDQGAKNN